MRKLLLWLAMVIAMVALILGGTAAFLYSRTGEKDLPQEAVTFGDTALTPNGWDWTIPVLGDKVSKHYQSPTNLTVQKLGTFTDTAPQLVLPDWVTRAEVTDHRARRHGLDRRCLHLQHLYLRRQRRLPNYCKSLPPGERAPRRRPGLVRLPRRVHHVDGPYRDPEQRPRRPGQRGGAVSHRYSGW